MAFRRENVILRWAPNVHNTLLSLGTSVPLLRTRISTPVLHQLWNLDGLPSSKKEEDTFFIPRFGMILGWSLFHPKNKIDSQNWNVDEIGIRFFWDWLPMQNKKNKTLTSPHAICAGMYLSGSAVNPQCFSISLIAMAHLGFGHTCCGALLWGTVEIGPHCRLSISNLHGMSPGWNKSHFN